MIPQRFVFICAVLLTFASSAGAQGTWTPLTHQPSFTASTALLLTDGTVMVQAEESSVWWRLTPDKTGNYVNGTWSQLASLPSGYAPRYYASAVLPDGRVVVEGGEDNNGARVETTLGAIYNPISNSWISITPPSGITQIGDASGIVLPNGSFMLGPVNSSGQWILNPSTLNWTLTGSGKADANSEENWALLPNGNVLTADTQNGTNSEIYNFTSGAWSSAGSTMVTLPSNNGDSRFVPELGPALLRPDGTVFATGATSNTAIYNPNTGSWSAGPVFPGGVGVADGPAALLPNGNVLVDAGPFQSPPSQFFEFNGTSLNQVASPTNTGNDPAFFGRMLVLPTGQILFTHSSSQIQIYTPFNGTYQSAWRPNISSSLPNTLNPSSINNFINGTQFNGLSQGASYGDDAQSATNYPLVQIINNATGDLAFARTHDHSTMAVATGSALVSTLFDVPANVETGPSIFRVVANGIPSPEMPVNVSFGASANCPETKCTLVQNAYISHFTGIDCTGGEHYYTPYFNSDGIRRSWDGQGFFGAALTTVTNRSWKGTDGVCHPDWPAGNTLTSFVTVYRDTQFTPVQGAYISHFTEANCTGQESYYTKYFNSDGIRRSWDGQGTVGSIIYTATTKSWKGSDGMCHNDWTTAPYNTLDGFVRVYR